MTDDRFDDRTVCDVCSRGEAVRNVAGLSVCSDYCAEDAQDREDRALAIRYRGVEYSCEPTFEETFDAARPNVAALRLRSASWYSREDALRTISDILTDPGHHMRWPSVDPRPGVAVPLDVARTWFAVQYEELLVVATRTARLARSVSAALGGASCL